MHVLKVVEQESWNWSVEFLCYTRKTIVSMPNFRYFEEILTFLRLPFSTYFWKNSTGKRPIHTPKIAKTLQSCIKIGKKYLFSVLEQELRKSYVKFLLQFPKTSCTMPKIDKNPIFSQKIQFWRKNRHFLDIWPPKSGQNFSKTGQNVPKITKKVEETVSIGRKPKILKIVVRLVGSYPQKPAIYTYF